MTAELVLTDVLMAPHDEVVEKHHRFEGVSHQGTAWNLAHLDPFAFRLDPGLKFEIDVVVLFSCHCFTVSLGRDGRPHHEIPVEEIFDNGREVRVLDAARYALSQQFLPRLVRELPHRRVQVAPEGENFFTLEQREDDGTTSRYAVFFDVRRDSRRARRLILHVQSAYLLDTLTTRLAKAGKVNFQTLMRKAYLGEKVRK